MIEDIFSFPVTQPFGVPDQSQSGHHTGVDLGLPSGTPVPAEGAGTVESTFSDAIGGNQVKVKYASGAEGWFAHLSSIFVRPGQAVTPTTEIALSGATGHVTGPHLHFEERNPGGSLVDPLSASARTYIGGLADPTGDTCPPGQVMFNGVCGYAGRGGFVPAGGSSGDRTLPSTIGRPGAGGAPLPGSAEVLAANGRGAADVGAFFTDLFTGTQRAVIGLAIGAGVVVVVGVLGFSGVKRTLD